jgi:hypothetical protein
MLKTVYEQEFLSLNPGESTTLSKTLKKIGLCWLNQKIEILDEHRWSQVSMLRRIQTRLPSTTNSLESFHGHQNQNTPRKNHFYKALFRLSEILDKKMMNFSNEILQGFRCAVHRSRRRHKTMQVSCLYQECEYYGTDLHQCNCGETKIYSAMYRADIPCSHRFELGADKPQLPEYQLHIEKQSFERRENTEFIERVPPPSDIDYNAYLQNLAVRNIRFYTHYQNKVILKDFVKDNFSVSAQYALGIPLSVINLISLGILRFSNTTTAISGSRSNALTNITHTILSQPDQF